MSSRLSVALCVPNLRTRALVRVRVRDSTCQRSICAHLDGGDRLGLRAMLHLEALHWRVDLCGGREYRTGSR